MKKPAGHELTSEVSLIPARWYWTVHLGICCGFCDFYCGVGVVLWDVRCGAGAATETETRVRIGISGICEFAVCLHMGIMEVRQLRGGRWQGTGKAAGGKRETPEGTKERTDKEEQSDRGHTTGAVTNALRLHLHNFLIRLSKLNYGSEVECLANWPVLSNRM